MTLNMLLMWNFKKLIDVPNVDQCQVIKKHQVDLMKYCHQLLYHNRDKISEDVSICSDPQIAKLQSAVIGVKSTVCSALL